MFSGGGASQLREGHGRLSGLLYADSIVGLNFNLVSGRQESIEANN